jgi:hypothetical protein
MQKERDKPPVTVPVLPCPLNNVNKINRNNRTPHPYLQGNNPRRSPSRVQSESDANPEEVPHYTHIFNDFLFKNNFNNFLILLI